MDSNRCFCFCFCSAILFIFLFMDLPASSSSSTTSISDGIFMAQASAGRSLLQAKKACPVNFEFADYKIITSKCKGPNYPPEPCCSSFKEFACPYAEELNDLTNDCASTMFSYIDLYGNYPAGLFSGECKEGKESLACPALPPSVPSNDQGGAHSFHPSPLFTTLLLGFITLFFWILLLG